jgi:lipid-A-disaccharide synthase
MRARRVFVSAGELSGDIAAARLIDEIKRRAPDAYVFGTGGARMAAAGVEIALDTNAVGVVGVTEIVRALPAVVTAFRRIRRRIAEMRPDVAILIGNDVFNVLLARWLKGRGIPTLAYFPPQVWLWASFARPIARSFDAIVASFPEEYEVYAQAGARTRVTFVGHYLADDLRPVTEAERAAARAQLGLPPSATVIGILPGSRRNEVASLTPVLLDAAAHLLTHERRCHFVVAAAESVDPTTLGGTVTAHSIARAASIARDSHAVMRSADLVLVASGTASLEAALLGVPMVIAYKVSALTHIIARSAIRLGLIGPYVVGLPNLVLGRTVVPELLQSRATAPAIAAEAWQLLATPGRLGEMRTALAAIGDRLRGPAAITRAAETVLHWP